MDTERILKYFYKEKTALTLFGEETIIQKEKDTTKIAAKLYKSRLNELFEFVSDPFIMKNSTNSIM